MRAVAVAFILTALSATPSATFTVTVHADEPVASTLPLVGGAMNPWRDDVVAHLAAAGVPHIRVPAYFDRASLSDGVWRWDEFDQRLGIIQAAGAEPVVVLGFMPPWLTACDGVGALEARYCPPHDLEAWRRVVAAGASRAATVFGVTAFEVWNEPDWAYFWRGSLPDYLALYEASALGVADAAAATGLDLAVGGPALLFADVAWLTPFFAFAAARSLPVDFVSYHWYADYPVVGAQPTYGNPGVADGANPALTVRSFRDHAVTVRALADAAGYRDAGIWVDEWNVNAGETPREENAFSSAFVVAAVREMQRGGVERAAYFKTQGPRGAWFTDDGDARPAWRASAALLALGPAAVAVTGDEPGVYAVAARDGAGVAAVVSRFDPQAAYAGAGAPAEVTLDVLGLRGAPFVVRDLDGAAVAAGRLPATVTLANLETVTVHAAP